MVNIVQISASQTSTLWKNIFDCVQGQYSRKCQILRNLLIRTDQECSSVGFGLRPYGGKKPSVLRPCIQHRNVAGSDPTYCKTTGTFGSNF